MKNLVIALTVCLVVTMLASGFSIATLNNKVSDLEAFQTKVDSVYMPNINVSLINNSHMDLWFQRSLIAIDSTKTLQARNEVIRMLQQQTQLKK